MTGNWYMAWLEEGVYQILQRCAKYSMKNEEECFRNDKKKGFTATFI